MTSPGATVVLARNLQKSFRRDSGETIAALTGISFEVRPGTLTALVGPDGAGKSTLMRLMAGLIQADGGDLEVVGVTVARDPQSVQDRIAYMPQKFGLYEDLSVQENLDLYADLHGVTVAQRQETYAPLMQMTQLGPFLRRPAGKLSGGMKQKLGLACTLVRSPQLLLLDEPTVGVDPLSRQDLWSIIALLVREQKLTVIVSTSYLDEAERGDHAIVLHAGRVLMQGVPGAVTALASGRTFLAGSIAKIPARQLQARLLAETDVVDAVPEAGRVRVVCAPTQPGESLQLGDDTIPLQPVAARFEDGFMILLHAAAERTNIGSITLDRPIAGGSEEDVVQVRDLVRTFGDFTAVNHVSFAVRRGQIYGLLGPNGAGKSTTFRMLCGLLPASDGSLTVAGADFRVAAADTRRRLGYVAQKFSLYGQITVDENLDFFASAYGLYGVQKRTRIRWAKEQFELDAFAALPAGQLPGGFKQRLAMAAALLHEPEILFLDEATSGADPMARREFWSRITSLAQQGVTVIVTTHFMEEAEYCDRLIILDAGRNLAEGTPAEIRSRAASQGGREPTMEDAFIAIVEQGRRQSDAVEPGQGG